MGRAEDEQPRRLRLSLAAMMVMIAIVAGLLGIAAFLAEGQQRRLQALEQARHALAAEARARQLADQALSQIQAGAVESSVALDENRRLRDEAQQLRVEVRRLRDELERLRRRPFAFPADDPEAPGP